MSLAGLPLAARLILVVALIEAGVMALSAAAMIGNARRAIAAEVDASLGLTRDYVVAAVGSLLRANDPETAVAYLPGTLFVPRHVRLVVLDHVGGVTHVPVSPRPSADGAPDWFRALLRPTPREVSLPIQVGARVYAEVLIASHPDDEIDEVWEDFGTLAAIAAPASAVLLAAVAIVVTRALRPLRRMSAAVARLGAGDYAARMGPVEGPELAPLAARFDALAAALADAARERGALNRRLLGAQDEERKAVALELHDEFGPCLFALRVEARAVAAEAERRGDPALAGHAAAIGRIVEQIQTANRALLSRLRPMEIGQLPLDQVLSDLVERMIGLGPELDWRVSIAPGLGPWGESADLTVYRILQEALTNVLRHAGASTVEVEVARAPGGVRLRVADDGRGLPADCARGVGLRGMRERAEALGGRLVVGPRPGGGVQLTAELPVVDIAPALGDAA